MLFAGRHVLKYAFALHQGVKVKPERPPQAATPEHLHISQFGDVWSVLPQGRPHRTGKDRRNTPEDRLQATPEATRLGRLKGFGAKVGPSQTR